MWLGFRQRDVSLKAVIGVPGFWDERAAKGGYLVWGFYSLKGIFALCFFAGEKTVQD